MKYEDWIKYEQNSELCNTKESKNKISLNSDRPNPLPVFSFRIHNKQTEEQGDKHLAETQRTP